MAILERITHDALDGALPSSEQLRKLRDEQGFDSSCMNASVQGKILIELDKVARSVKSGDLSDTALYALQALRILATATAPVESICSVANASWKYALLRVRVLVGYAEVNWSRVNIAVVESTQIFLMSRSQGCKTRIEPMFEAVLGGLKKAARLQDAAYLEFVVQIALLLEKYSAQQEP